MFTESKKEKTDRLAREAYLKAHLAENPFPLDGSNWARLIRERQYLEAHPNCKCDTCVNLLTRLHGKESLLKRQRTAILKAMHHWFLHDEDTNKQFWIDNLAINESDKDKEDLKDLHETEEAWLAENLFSNCAQRSLDNFAELDTALGIDLEDDMESTEKRLQGVSDDEAICVEASEQVPAIGMIGAGGVDQQPVNWEI